jgi:Ca-activated chloride channel family protein
MHFGEPQAFWFLLAIPLWIAFFIWAYQQKQKALEILIAKSLHSRIAPYASQVKQVLRWSLFIAAYICLVFALSKPRFGVKMEIIERRGVDIMLALDISNSMEAEDIVPNRLDRARHEIGKFLDLCKGDRVGLIVFAGQSFVQCPLTLDYGAIKMLLNGVSTNWIDIQGTVISQAIDQSIRAFKGTSHKSKALIILSDGEDHEEAAETAAKNAANEGIRIFTVGIGSTSGVPIPMRHDGSSITYKKDASGNLVMTRLNAENLERIALAGNGSYHHAGSTLSLDAVYAEIARMEKSDFGRNRSAVYEERYQWFLALAFMFLLLEFFISPRRRQVTPRRDAREIN